jgi:hypothetical protein
MGRGCNASQESREIIFSSVHHTVGRIAQEQEQEEEPFETIIKQRQSGQTERKNFVITNRDDWVSLWDVVHSPVQPQPPLREVDLTERIVIAVLLGEQPLSGSDISITKLVKDGKKIRVFTRQTLENLACPGPPISVQPYHIIEIDRIKKPKKNVKFQEPEQEMKRCQ